jgi:glucoamylase
MRGRLLSLAAIVGGAAAMAFASVPGGAVAQDAGPPRGAAPDGPGALSHFDLARKDCVGTARNRRSKVWFTVADGVLSDVYFPTNDNTNNETLQFVVTDGSGFTDLQTRDMTYAVRALDDRALTCRVISTAKSGRYRIATDYVTDPDRPTVVLRSRFEALRGGDYRVYVRFDPSLNGNGGGGEGNGGPDSGGIARAQGHTLLVGSTRSPRPTRRTATTPCRCTAPSTPRVRSGRFRTASPAGRATASRSSTRAGG